MKKEYTEPVIKAYTVKPISIICTSPDQTGVSEGYHRAMGRGYEWEE